jgi:Ni,Fe-hydrogenase I cytochrome b subunit
MTLSVQSILLIIIDFRFFLWFCDEQSFLCILDTCIFILGINSNLKLYILFLLQKSHEACSKVYMESLVTNNFDM